MSEHKIELIFFDGCPNADEARANLESALDGGPWREWNLSSPDTPERFRRYGSPTVLIDGRDVTGEQESGGAMACRADGAPSAEVIREGLASHG